MPDALTDTAPQGQNDVLTEHVAVPKSVETPVIEKSFDDTLRDAVEKTINADAPDKDEKPAKVVAKPKVDAVKPDVIPKDTKEAPKEVTKDPIIQSDDEPDVTPKSDDAPKRPTAYRDPPSGFDDAAKGEWEAVPETVRGAMHRRHQEMEQGINKYRQAAQDFEPVRQYAEMAKQGGTDLQTALSHYVGMEQQLRESPIAGLQAVVANLGLKNNDGSPVTLRDVAASIMGQSPDQAASQQEATISQLSQKLQQVTQKLGGFTQHFEQQQQQAKVSNAETEWGAFQRENPRATQLEPHIAEFLTKYPAGDRIPVSERLHDAYKWAAAQNPSVAHTDATPLVQTQIEAKATPNPAGQKSISGIGGGTQGARKMSSDDAMRLAISRFSKS